MKTLYMQLKPPILFTTMHSVLMKMSEIGQSLVAALQLDEPFCLFQYSAELKM